MTADEPPLPAVASQWETNPLHLVLRGSPNWVGCQACLRLLPPSFTHSHPFSGSHDPLQAPSAAQVSQDPHCEVGEGVPIMRATLLHTEALGKGLEMSPAGFKSEQSLG